MSSNIKLYIENDSAAVGKKAAEIFAQQVIATPTGAFGFATGSSPLEMYNELKQKHAAGEIDLSKITAYNLDEYFPLSGSDPQSYKYFMAENLFDAVGLPMENRFIPSGEAKDAAEECAAYDEKLNNSGGIQMQILGIGTNGHVGFNEPADFFAGGTNYCTLAEETITANARFFEKLEDVPRFALTMGIRSILMAKRIILVALGENKAHALKESLFGKITPHMPASALQLHHDVTVVADKAAASLI